MDKTDESLIIAHCRGDKTAFGELLRRYGDNLLGYLMRITGSREQAEDLFQETFKRVHEKAHTFGSGAFKSWLFTIATRVAIDSFRRHSRLSMVSLNQKVDCNDIGGEALEDVAVAKNCSEPWQQSAQAEQKELVRQALDSLPAGQKATLILAYYQDLSYAEVAEVMGCSIGTVKTQMFRALKTLAQKLPDV